MTSKQYKSECSWRAMLIEKAVRKSKTIPTSRVPRKGMKKNK